MQKGEYIVIKVADIEAEIKKAKKYQTFTEKYSTDWIKCQCVIDNLNYISEKRPDLYDVVSEVYTSGLENVDLNRENYLNNLQI